MFKIRSKIEKKLLNYFFLNENTKVYINEIARLIGEDPKNVYRILKKLEGNGILTSSFVGKKRFFSIDKINPFLKEYKNIFINIEGLPVLFKEKLHSIDGIQEAYIFGSYAEGKITDHNDIDILIIGDYDISDVQRKLFSLQKTINREINLVNLTPQEYAKRKKRNDRFIRQIFKKKIIKLI